MTETRATAGAPAFPPGRYGRRREPRRAHPVRYGLALAAVVALGVLAAVRLYQFYGDPTYDARLISYSGITDTQVTVEFAVNVPAGGAAVCALRARAYDGAEVGRTQASVRASPGSRQAVGREVVPTRARPFIGEVVRCRGTG